MKRVLDGIAAAVVVVPWVLVLLAVAMVLGTPIWLAVTEGGRAWALFGVIYGTIAFCGVYGWADGRLRKRARA